MSYNMHIKLLVNTTAIGDVLKEFGRDIDLKVVDTYADTNEYKTITLEGDTKAELRVKVKVLYDRVANEVKALQEEITGSLSAIVRKDKTLAVALTSLGELKLQLAKIYSETDWTEEIVDAEEEAAKKAGIPIAVVRFYKLVL